MVTSSKRAYAIPISAAPRAPVPAADHRWPVPPQETLKHSLSQSLWSPWVLVYTRFVWTLLVSLGEMGFDSKRESAPAPILLGLLLCPWTWGISSQWLQHLLSYWGFSDLGRGISPQGHHSWPWMWDISSQPLQHCAASARYYPSVPQGLQTVPLLQLLAWSTPAQPSRL